MLSILTGSSVKIIAILCVVVGLIGSGAYVEHKVDLGTINALKASYAQAEATALQEAATRQKKLDDDSAQADKDALVAATTLTASLQDQLARIPNHVTVIKGPGNCITYGLLRVLDAAVYGSDPASLNLPAGKSDGSCSGVDAPTLARIVVGNYGKYKLTAQQLTELQAYVRSLQKDTAK